MASLDRRSANVPQPTVSGRPQIFYHHISTNAFRGEVVNFQSGGGRGPAISASGAVDIVLDRETESVAGWQLGWFQLQFIETNYARYRGRSEREGMVLVSRSHRPPRQLCRDFTDEYATPEDRRSSRPSPVPLSASLYYEDPAQHGARTFTVPPRPRLAPDPTDRTRLRRRLRMRSEFSDQPSQTYWVKVRNPRTNADNFLYHVDIDFHFCTMLVAMSLPPGEQPRYTPLKHFYWNILWEAHFTMDASGSPNERATRVRHLEVNVQRQVRSDAPNDPRFVRRLEDRSLPISNELATHLPAVRLGTSWSDRSLGAFLPDRAVQDLFWPPR